jgi:hypothetical protein
LLPFLSKRNRRDFIDRRLGADDASIEYSQLATSMAEPKASRRLFWTTLHFAMLGSHFHVLACRSCVVMSAEHASKENHKPAGRDIANRYSVNSDQAATY